MLTSTKATGLLNRQGGGAPSCIPLPFLRDEESMAPSSSAPLTPSVNLFSLFQSWSRGHRRGMVTQPNSSPQWKNPVTWPPGSRTKAALQLEGQQATLSSLSFCLSPAGTSKRRQKSSLAGSVSLQGSGGSHTLGAELWPQASSPRASPLLSV